FDNVSITRTLLQLQQVGTAPARKTLKGWAKCIIVLLGGFDLPGMLGHPLLSDRLPPRGPWLNEQKQQRGYDVSRGSSHRDGVPTADADCRKCERQSRIGGKKHARCREYRQRVNQDR